MKRRNFLKHIKTSTICGLTLPLTGLTSSSNKFKKITILHTNDVHSHIDPFPRLTTYGEGFSFHELKLLISIRSITLFISFITAFI